MILSMSAYQIQYLVPPLLQGIGQFVGLEHPIFARREKRQVCPQH